IVFCFFFSSRRRHTRSDRDWSSDVCSSDLIPLELSGIAVNSRGIACDLSGIALNSRGIACDLSGITFDSSGIAVDLRWIAFDLKIGRASCRERVEISMVAALL